MEVSPKHSPRFLVKSEAKKGPYQSASSRDEDA